MENKDFENLPISAVWSIPRRLNHTPPLVWRGKGANCQKSGKMANEDLEYLPIRPSDPCPTFNLERYWRRLPKIRRNRERRSEKSSYFGRLIHTAPLVLRGTRADCKKIEKIENEDLEIFLFWPSDRRPTSSVKRYRHQFQKIRGNGERRSWEFSYLLVSAVWSMTHLKSEKVLAGADCQQFGKMENKDRIFLFRSSDPCPTSSPKGTDADCHIWKIEKEDIENLPILDVWSTPHL